MTPTVNLGRSFVLSSAGGWMAILGIAITFGPHEVYAEGEPLPLVNGLKLTVLPAATIAVIQFSGYFAIAAGFLLLTAGAVQRATARRH